MARAAARVMISGEMAAWLKRTCPSLLADALIVLALTFPEACTYLRWPLLGAYAVISRLLFRELSAHRWILTIVRDPATRIAHGLEHATIAVLSEDGLPVIHGFTHGRDRFVVAVKSGSGARLDFTVSTDFSSASVSDVRDMTRIYRRARPEDETWFEIIVDVRVDATKGGLVTPGALA